MVHPAKTLRGFEGNVAPGRAAKLAYQQSIVGQGNELVASDIRAKCRGAVESARQHRGLLPVEKAERPVFRMGCAKKDLPGGETEVDEGYLVGVDNALGRKAKVFPSRYIRAPCAMTIGKECDRTQVRGPSSGAIRVGPKNVLCIEAKGLEPLCEGRWVDRRVIDEMCGVVAW